MMCDEVLDVGNVEIFGVMFKAGSDEMEKKKGGGRHRGQTLDGGLFQKFVIQAAMISRPLCTGIFYCSEWKDHVSH